MAVSRRHFLTMAAMGTGALLLPQGLQLLYQRAAQGQSVQTKGFGSLVKDPQGILDLPPGFQYRVFSKLGDPMSDGYRVPSLHDGMASFPGANGTTILVRNHEVYPGLPSGFRPVQARPDQKYDPLCPGGTTTLVVSKDRQLIQDCSTLAGTYRNCAGGSTPWKTWISCEENVSTPENPGRHGPVQKRHGYNFEVPIAARGLVTPIPLKAMGRFQHEAIAVDPQTNIIYQTEDRGDGLFYRFIPNKPGDLPAGGTLQALKIKSAPKINTRLNFPVGRSFDVEWVDIPEPDPADDTVRFQGFNKGAALFTRGEGICYSKGEFYFTATSGGTKRLGQIWRYRPGATADQGGTLELFVESPDKGVLNYPDNIVMAPFGDLICCEDGEDEINRLVGVTPQGRMYTFALNALNSQEFAGVCFSADGQTMFVNIYHPGMTFAIWGPWTTRT
ncbi:PhoX family protein [Candidatus Synechococcus calcipolaris G9]|uniref:PhoX family protein n=1 Tax=Candidatus Synechococcus calcipolaris G9 TaxID=1497997 RepID=A0ABT6EWE2_9SYNE|nr:alkaline phosphatase PhoX [Candidatus Synechococcus calcipolaris]MDG2990102.1 PhoX family protein [Candidatus Synechococcus calcipolaris G9]